MIRPPAESRLREVMRVLSLLALLLLHGLNAAQVEQSTSPVPPTTSLGEIVSIPIYDSISQGHPLELRERGTLHYSALNRSGTFSESGVHSQPHGAAKTIYRIGTEEALGTFLMPAVPGLLEGSVDEILKVHLDLYGKIFHVGYHMSVAKQDPGSFEVVIDHMADHMGPEIQMLDRVKKSRSTKSNAAENADGPSDQLVEDEEDVPEKSFLQKYWIYGIPVVALLLLGGGSEQG